MPVLFCHVRHRSLLFIPVEVEMAEECLRLKTEPNKVSTLIQLAGYKRSKFLTRGFACKRYNVTLPSEFRRKRR